METSLEVIDVLYKRSVERTKLDIFVNEPIVHEFVDDLFECKENLLLVANLITEQFKEETE